MARKPKTKRYSIDEFCATFKIKKLEFAGYLDVLPQQITNWKNANLIRHEEDGRDAYIVELNVEKASVNIIKNEKIMNSFKIEVMG